MSDEDDRADDRERRGQLRAPIALKVEYKRLNTFFYDYTKNISKGGTFIKTDRPLEIGTLFLFQLHVPAAPAPIELRGEVRWVVRPGEPPPPPMTADHEAGMGIRFVYASEAERGRSTASGSSSTPAWSLRQPMIMPSASAAPSAKRARRHWWKKACVCRPSR
jgi:type IV pilus assembly protein PilZ